MSEESRIGAGAAAAPQHADPTSEYAAVRSAVGIADREDRARLRLWGKDPVRMMHGLITNDLQQAGPGQGVYGAMLTPRGRMVTDLRAFRLERGEGPELLVELSREALEGTAAHLRKFVPPLFARWADVSAEVRQFGAYGPRAHVAVARALGAEVPVLEEDRFVEVPFAGGPVVVAGTREIGLESGFDLFVPAVAGEAAWTALARAAAAEGGRPVGFAALETLRMEAGRPRFGAELSEEVIPTEAYEESGLMPRAVSFQKGCYTGQEVIVRIAHRGHVNRHLRGLLLGDAPAPARGTPLLHPESGKEVGRVTGGTYSPRLGETLALGYVRREVPPGAVVRIGSLEGAPATVARLPIGADPPS